MIVPENYEWMSAKMSGELKTEDEAYDFSGNLRMRRDSTVWITVSGSMGMEGARVLITQDSVIVVNRVDKTYFMEPLSVIAETEHTPSLQDLQVALLGDGVSDHVTLQWGPYIAIIRYSDVQWNKPLSFPIKINKKYERVRL